MTLCFEGVDNWNWNIFLKAPRICVLDLLRSHSVAWKLFLSHPRRRRRSLQSGCFFVDHITGIDLSISFADPFIHSVFFHRRRREISDIEEKKSWYYTSQIHIGTFGFVYCQGSLIFLYFETKEDLIYLF